MTSRGPWDQQRAERCVAGFYKFNPPQVRLDERSFDELSEIDPGLPTWPEFLALLEGSDMRRFVYA
jgi:hypothetical protein